MTAQERRQRAKIRRKKQVAKQKMVLLLATILIITIGSVVFGSIFSGAENADANMLGHKCYKSIEIEHGDSLWSIADQYCDDKTNIKEYVQELKELNSLTSETIHAGEHLLVAYYDVDAR